MANTSANAPFEGAKALIFGSAKGIGRGVAFEWARRGAKLVVADIDQAAAAATAAEIERAGGKALAIAADVTSDESMEAAAAAVEQAFGEIDILMNNVGAALTGHPQDIPLREWRRITELNYFGTLRALGIFLPKFLARRAGHIVNTASFAGLYPYAISRMPYVAAKAAVIALSESLAIYLEPQGIRVSCLMPGPVKTDIMASHTSWSDDCVLIGPGADLDMLQPAHVAVTLSDGMRDGAILIPTHMQAWDTVKSWAESPDAFIRRKIAEFARGEFGRPRIAGINTTGDKP
jgi:NAD(P)-dependent dehydrogenase (short-subunit alcohol dehydrogenase family)